MSTLLIATRNLNKVAEIRLALADLSGLEVVSASDFPQIPEPEEDGDTFLANAVKKAEYYHKQTQLPALADDSGLVVDALGGRPGVLSSRYGSDDAHRIARLLEEMRDIPDPQRTARFECAMVLAAGDAKVSTTGTLEGRIIRTRRGSQGFGYDPVFFVPALDCTLAEVPREAKNQISHRGQALRQMLAELHRRFA